MDTRGFQRGMMVTAIRAVPHPVKRREYVAAREAGTIEGFVACVHWASGMPVQSGVDAFVRWSDGAGEWQPINNLKQA